MFSQQVQEILQRVADKWDNTEGVVKEAENLTGDAVGATMFELRYAGRRLVDAVREACRSNPDVEAIVRHVREVEENCDRAHHDAIDAIVYYLRQSLRISEQTFGPDLLMEYWNNYLNAKTLLDEVGLIVVQSRVDRANRVEIYEKLRRETIPQILHLIGELSQSDEALKALAERRKKEDENRQLEAERSTSSLATSNRNLKVAVWTLAVTVVLGVIGFAITLSTSGSDKPPGKAQQEQQLPGRS